MLFKIPIGLFGDSYDRYLLRIHEMQISTQLVLDTIFKTPYGAILANNKKIRAPRRMELKKGMEEIIAHFKYYSSGPYFKRRHYYTQVEAPKGETGVFLWAK
jgi:NADH:ubiquinone oxidoreductase subunit D